MSFFEYFGIEESFFVDKQKLRSLYLSKSREVHPDILDESSEEALEIASFNNDAYNTLSDDWSTLKYILELNHIPLDAKSYTMPQDFLFEMMEINEEIIEVKTKQNEEALIDLQNKIAGFKSQLTEHYTPILASYNAQNKEEILLQARDYLLKMNYFKRLEQQLNDSAEL